MKAFKLLYTVFLNTRTNNSNKAIVPNPKRYGLAIFPADLPNSYAFMEEPLLLNTANPQIIVMAITAIAINAIEVKCLIFILDRFSTPKILFFWWNYVCPILFYPVKSALI